MNSFISVLVFVTLVHEGASFMCYDCKGVCKSPVEDVCETNYACLTRTFERNRTMIKTSGCVDSQIDLRLCESEGMYKCYECYDELCNHEVRDVQRYLDSSRHEQDADPLAISEDLNKQDVSTEIPSEVDNETFENEENMREKTDQEDRFQGDLDYGNNEGRQEVATEIYQIYHTTTDVTSDTTTDTDTITAETEGTLTDYTLNEITVLVDKETTLTTTLTIEATEEIKPSVPKRIRKEETDYNASTVSTTKVSSTTVFGESLEPTTNTLLPGESTEDEIACLNCTFGTCHRPNVDICKSPVGCIIIIYKRNLSSLTTCITDELSVERCKKKTIPNIRSCRTCFVNRCNAYIGSAYMSAFEQMRNISAKLPSYEEDNAETEKSLRSGSESNVLSSIIICAFLYAIIFYIPLF